MFQVYLDEREHMQTSRCGPSIQILPHVTLHPNERHEDLKKEK